MEPEQADMAAAVQKVGKGGVWMWVEVGVGGWVRVCVGECA